MRGFFLNKLAAVAAAGLAVGGVALLRGADEAAKPEAVANPRVLIRGERGFVEIEGRPVTFYLVNLDLMMSASLDAPAVRRMGARIDCRSYDPIFADSPLVFGSGWSPEASPPPNSDLRMVIVCGDKTYGFDINGSRGTVDGRPVIYDARVRRWFERKVRPLNAALFAVTRPVSKG